MYEALLKATPEYQKIAASFAKPGPAALFGLPPAGRALLYACLLYTSDESLSVCKMDLSFSQLATVFASLFFEAYYFLRSNAH